MIYRLYFIANNATMYSGNQNMDIRGLELFRDLSQTLHFGKTSQRCNISPSALTRAIKRLEEEVGCDLFIRDNRSVSLTASGNKFVTYAEESIRNWHQLRRELDDGQGEVAGEISLYSSVTAVYGILPDIFTRFRQLYPEVHVKLETGDAASAIAKIQSGDVDVVVTALPDTMPPKLQFLRLLETPLVTIGPRSYSELPQRNEDNSINWRSTPMILSERGLSRSRLNNWFKSEEIEPNIYAQVSGNEAIIAMVRLGCGIGIVPSLVLEQSPFKDDVIILPEGPELSPFFVGVCAERSRMKSAVLKAFWDTCESARA